MIKFKDIIIEELINKLSNYKAKELQEKDYTKSSVLLSISLNIKTPSIIFIKRSNMVKHHKGEVSYPGGVFDRKKDNNLLETAIRETEEEIGVKKSYINIICPLDDELTFSTNFLVRPFLSFINCRKIIPNSIEVEKIIYVPIRNLLLQRTHKELILNNKDIKIHFSYYYRNILIWGATARILNNFLNLLQKYNLDKIFTQQNSRLEL